METKETGGGSCERFIISSPSSHFSTVKGIIKDTLNFATNMSVFVWFFRNRFTSAERTLVISCFLHVAALQQQISFQYSAVPQFTTVFRFLDSLKFTYIHM